jgi:hypothetical protein
MSKRKNPARQPNPQQEQPAKQDITYRRLPVRPSLDQLKHQAKELLRAIHRGEPTAIAEFNTYHPRPIAPSTAEGPTRAQAGQTR